MKSTSIASENFSCGDKHYFLDFMNGTNYLRITRSDRSGDKRTGRKSIIIFEEDLPLFISGLSSLFHHAAYSLDAQGTQAKAKG